MNTDLSLIFSQIFYKINQLAYDKSRLAFLGIFDGHWFCRRGSPFSCVRPLYKSLFLDSSREKLLRYIYINFQNYYSRVFPFTSTKSEEYLPTCYLISIYTTKFSCANEHLSFALNLQKSQFVGIVESRAANVLYLISEDIAETKNAIICN